MKLFTNCQVCGRWALLIKNRVVNLPHNKGKATSKKEMCGACARTVKKMVK